ncbi:hypothetical protein tb265_36450 [Gemmatimonadetes bacterium T265]|nr:hypothetical protein tb265_36450 [Gemmatimonadetes bacterium T265]
MLSAPIRVGSAGVGFAVILPELDVVRNSAIDVADNDGALWAGRGANVLLRGGIAVRAGPFTAVLDPELTYSQNLAYQSQPAFSTGQRPGIGTFAGSFAAQWFTGPYSADLPTRFGDQSYSVVGLGQSYVGLTTGPVVFGLSSENQWWGPGTRNALLMSNAGEGVPHAFVRTARPLHTRFGDVEARWMLGEPTGSLYFNVPASVPDGRVLNGAVATLRVAAAPDVTVGLARLVLSPGQGSIFAHAFDVLIRNQNLGTGDTLRTGLRSDQLTSVFSRWIIPSARTEVYGEFARLELPRSIRDFLIAPLNTGAYTLGLAHAWITPAAGALRASVELTNLEQTRNFSDRPPPPDYYTGRAAPRGFTTRGQPLGAAIGPGSSSQWTALDYYTPRWQLGVFAQRTRNQNDALYRVALPNAFRHDVSLAGGLRGGVRYAGVDARATLAYTDRLNYLFQNGTFNYLGIGSVDVQNLTLGLSLSPAPRASR